MLVLGIGAIGFTGGLWAAPTAEPTVQAFLLDWQQQHYQAAAALTTGNPAVVARALRGAFRQLDAAAFYLGMGPIEQHGSTALAQFQASVDLGQDGAPWNYMGRLTLRREGPGWKIVWSPSVINPHLRQGLRLAVLSSVPPRALLLDGAGQPLQTRSPVYVVGVRPARLRHPALTARALSRITGIDEGQLLGWILAAPSQRVQDLVVLRQSQYVRFMSPLQRVPGQLIIRREPRRLFTSIAPDVVGSVGTEDSPALEDQGIAYRPGTTIGLTGLQRAYQRQLAGSPTTEVVTEAGDGTHITVLQRWPGSPAQPIRTTINAGWQRAADSAVRSLPDSAAAVAVQASTGQILAVASHKAPGLPAVSPLTGHYPPGTAFSIVSTEALLTSAAGLDVHAPVRCVSANDIDGTTFRNVPPEPNLGNQPPFSTDFAHACATALSGLSRLLRDQELNSVASRFGIGGRWQLGLSAFAGSVQAAGGPATLAADAIGGGSVQMSPLAMAMIAAEVDSGVLHTPVLVGHTSATTSHAAGPDLNAASLGTLRALLRGSAAASGAATGGLPGQPVYGQQGTVLVNARAHVWAYWFVGYRGDVAFAVLSLSHTPPVSAAPGNDAVTLTGSLLARAPRR